MRIIGVDPGTTESATVVVDMKSDRLLCVVKHEKSANINILKSLSNDVKWAHIVAVEKIVSNGQRVNYQTMDTAMWAGIFLGVSSASAHYCVTGYAIFAVPRPAIRWHLGKARKVTDATIRSVLTERFGKLPLVGDEWSALAAAITCYDRQHDPEFGSKYRMEN